jgi:ATP-dependent Lhr-like helicase
VLAGFDPLTSEWFTTRLGRTTEPHQLEWPEIGAGRDVLISAPTESGKTLAAFLICIDNLVRLARAGALSEQTAAVYVSPLKALSNDVHKNLEVPLAEISALAARRGVPLAPIRVALRTPHILVTTESLFILLTASKPREMLARVSTVIVDEIHAIADDKRGSHLALTLAHLDHLVSMPERTDLQRLRRKPKID